MSSLHFLKKLGGQTVVYGLSGILSRFLSVLLVPIYTRVFLPTDYGVIAIVTALSALLNILIILGLDNSVGRWYYDSDDQQDRIVTISTFLWSCVITACGFSVLLFSFHNILADKVLNEPRAASALLVVALTLPLSVFQSFTWNLLRIQHRAKMTMVFSIVTSLLTIGFSILFVLLLKIGIIGIFIAQLCSAFAAAVWTLILFRNQIHFRAFSVKRWKEMLVFSYPLVPGSIAFWVVNLSGTYFIQLMRTTHDVGLFQIGASLASCVGMVTGAFQMAWGPFAYSIHKEENAKKVFAETLQVYTVVACGISLFVAIFAKEILYIFTTENYIDAYKVAGILSYNYFIIGLTYLASIGTSIAKNNKAFGISMIVSAVALVGLNFLLIPPFGKEGAALSIVVSQMIVPVTVFWHAQKLYPVPYNFKKVTGLFLFSCLLAFSSTYIGTRFSESFLMGYLIKACFLLTYAVAAFFLVVKEFKKTSPVPSTVVGSL